MSRIHKAKGDERDGYRGPSHERHVRRRRRKYRREREVRDRRVTEEHGERGHGSCGRKVRFRCLHDARSYVEEYHLRKGGNEFHAYRCAYCNGWHITRHPDRDGESVRI